MEHGSNHATCHWWPYKGCVSILQRKIDGTAPTVDICIARIYYSCNLLARWASGFLGDHQHNHQCLLWFHSCYKVTHVFCPSLVEICWEQNYYYYYYYYYYYCCCCCCCCCCCLQQVYDTWFHRRTANVILPRSYLVFDFQLWCNIINTEDFHVNSKLKYA